MTRTILLAVSLALAAPSTALAQAKDDAAAKQPAPSKKASAKKPAAKATASRATDAKTAAERKKKGATQGNPAQLAAVARMKSIFMFAVETCERPEKCDEAMRSDAERQFLDACRACASAERCEAERDAIKGARTTKQSNPCVEE